MDPARSTPIVETFPVGLLQCNCTILGDPATGEAIVVDPGGDIEKVLAALERHGLRCRAIVNTHTHIDHVGANQALRERTGARVMLHEADVVLYDHLDVQAEMLGLFPPPPRSPVDEHIHQGDAVRAGGLDLEVLRLNQRAYERLQAERALEVVPGASHLFEEAGALEEVARLATDWFRRHFHVGIATPAIPR